MKAALMTTVGAPLELHDLIIPSDSPSYGQVQVRIIASGICGAQLMELNGTKASGPLPHPLGHEGVGIVEKVGIGVTHVKVGDKCVLHWRKGAGIESDFPHYLMAGRSEFITSGKVSTFMEQAIVSENRCTAVPHDTPDELCCLLGCSLSTALGTIEHEAKLLMGESVLIIGCGGLGLNLILAAKIRGASKIGATDIHIEKETASSALGAGFLVNFGFLTKPKFDVVIDTTGNSIAIQRGLSLMNPSGRFILVGQPPPRGYVKIENANHLFEGSGKSIMATQGGRFQPDKDIKRYVDSWRAGHLKVDGIVTHEFGLSEINAALDVVRAGEAGRILIKMP
jgi:S-(hydroxymethyl)glutathione dehydrogenase/alcohol dehydrogenase